MFYEDELPIIRSGLCFTEAPAPVEITTTIVLLSDLVMAEVIHAQQLEGGTTQGKCLRILLMSGDWTLLNNRSISVNSEHPDYTVFLSAVDLVIDETKVGTVAEFQREVKKAESSSDTKLIYNYPVCVEIDASEIAAYLRENKNSAIIKVNYRAETI